MPLTWTPSQAQRLKELGASDDITEFFETEQQREAAFTDAAARLQAAHRRKIRELTSEPHRHQLAQLESDLAGALIARGFIEVKTPMMISADALNKMGINESHPLREQVFWVDEKRALRPMLAPNLYFLMRHLKRSVKMPLRLFEIGPCFRKESHGNTHLEEFTMLNLVELKPEVDAMERLEEHIALVMRTVGLEYALVPQESEVYVKTVDVEVNGVELASGAVGPHILDKAHGITDPWSGVGFGLERILLMRNGETNIKKVGRSLIYLDGARIDI